jgi:hypothetical protein
MDIRFPIGLLFSAVGLLLTTFGAFSNREIYRASLGVNVNLEWGAVMLGFGVVMLYFARRAGASRKDKIAGESSELARTATRSER